jgi:hypothetical protein
MTGEGDFWKGIERRWEGKARIFELSMEKSSSDTTL